jgi:hypothetical protein
MRLHQYADLTKCSIMRFFGSERLLVSRACGCLVPGNIVAKLGPGLLLVRRAFADPERIGVTVVHLLHQKTNTSRIVSSWYFCTSRQIHQLALSQGTGNLTECVRRC